MAFCAKHQHAYVDACIFCAMKHVTTQMSQGEARRVVANDNLTLSKEWRSTNRALDMDGKPYSYATRRG